MSRDEICSAINQRITDLGLEDTDTNCYGLVCYDDDGVGSFRIDGDGSGAIKIDGLASLKALETVDYTGDFEADQGAFYAALVAAE